MKVQQHCRNSSQKWCGEYRTYPSPCSPVFAQRWVGWLVEILLLVEGSGHWITVTGVKPPSVWLFQRKIYRSPAFGSNFKNVLKPAIYPRQSRSANGDSVGNNCFDGAPGSAFLLQPFIGSRRLEIGATQIGSQPYTRILASPIIGLSSTDWPVSRPFTRSSSGRREGAEQDFQPLKGDW